MRSEIKLVLVILVILCLILFYNIANFNKSSRVYEVTYLNLSESLYAKNKIFDLDFKYIIENNEICKNTSNIQAVILVTSYFGNVETRSAMRRAFSSQRLQEFNFRRVFLLGIGHNDTYVSQKAVLNENNRFGDLIQGNFNEAYRNLTYKHIMGLKWAAEHCNNAKYVIKMDDDIVINMYKIIDLLKTNELASKDLLAGYVLSNKAPIRMKQNKWFVKNDEYNESFYPSFISGWFYITNPATCKKIVDTSRTLKYFWVDDIYVTGIIAQQLNIKHFNLKEYFTVHPEILQCCMNDVQKKRFDCEVLVGPNGGDNNLFFNFNKVMTECYYKQCYKRNKPLKDTCVAEKKFPLGKGSASVETYKLS